jgi:hypothetical protein
LSAYLAPAMMAAHGTAVIHRCEDKGSLPLRRGGQAAKGDLRGQWHIREDAEEVGPGI